MNSSLPNKSAFTPDNPFSSIRMSYRMAVEREREYNSPGKKSSIPSGVLKKEPPFPKVNEIIPKQYHIPKERRQG